MELMLPGPDGLIVTQFDAEDAPKFLGGGWRVQRYGKKLYVRSNAGGVTRLAHRILLGLVAGDGRTVDHCNGDSLDNRKSNLRICTNQQNLWNKKSRNKTTGFMGVTRHRDHRFVAKIRHNGAYHYCGLHETAELAAQAVNQKLIELRGEFAHLNRV